MIIVFGEFCKFLFIRIIVLLLVWFILVDKVYWWLKFLEKLIILIFWFLWFIFFSNFKELFIFLLLMKIILLLLLSLFKIFDNLCYSLGIIFDLLKMGIIIE